MGWEWGGMGVPGGNGVLGDGGGFQKSGEVAGKPG